MARKTLENERFLKYKDGDSEISVWLFQGKPTISVDCNSVTLNSNQARHIAKKLIQFADDIEKEIE